MAVLAVAHSRSIKRVFAIDRRKACRRQDDIALTKRNGEAFGKMKDHVAAWPRPPGLQKAQVALRDFRIRCKRQLAQPAPSAPVPQEMAGRLSVFD